MPPSNPRFVPVASLGQGGVPTTGAPPVQNRFLPVGRTQPAQGSQARFQPSRDNSINLAGVASMLGSGASWLSRLPGMENSGLSAAVPALGGIGGALGLVQGIQNGNVYQSLGGAARLGSSIAHYAGYPGVSSALGAVGGPIQLAGGIASGDTGSIVGGAANTAMTVLSQVTPYASLLAIPAAVAGMVLSNIAKKDAEKKYNKLRETGDIRRDANVAAGQLQAGSQAAQQLGTLGNLTGPQLTQALQRIADTGQQAMSASPAMSRFISTKGGKNTFAGVSGLDTSGAESMFGPTLMDSIIGRVRATDTLARLGQPLGTTWQQGLDPRWTVNQLASMAGAKNLYAYGLPTLDPTTGAYVNSSGTPELAYQPTGLERDPSMLLGPDWQSKFTPGNFESTLVDLFTRANPQFATSQLGQRLGTLGRPTLTLTPAQQQTNMLNTLSMIPRSAPAVISQPALWGGLQQSSGVGAG